MLIELAIGNLANRGHIIESRDIFKYLNEGQELYRSYFGFDERIKEHLMSGRKSAAGFIGDFQISQVVLDIDRGKDTLEHTIFRMRNVANRLIKDFDLEENFQVWFSGTGFHIHLPDIFGFKASNDLPARLKATVDAHFPEADTKPINPRGLIRVGRTLNAKSNLYKIPIKEHEIWFLKEEELMKWASSPRKDVKPIPYQPLVKYFTQIEPAPKEETLIKVSKPNDIVTCMQHCYNAGEVEGTRHIRIMSMASWQYRNGTPLSATIAMMKSYAPSLAPYEVEKSVTDLYDKGGYNYGCESEVMKQFCDSQCIFYNKKNYLPDVFGSAEVEREYNEEMKRDWQKNSLNLASFLGIDDKKGYWLRPGHVIGIQGDTGLSKSALMQNLALEFRKFGKFLYINTEMPHTELYERFVQIELGIDSEEVRARHLAGMNGFSDLLHHIEYTKSVPDYNGIVTLATKIKPKILIVDVIDDIKPGKERSVSGQEDMYAGLKDLSRKSRIITFLVHHINKSSATDERGNRKQLTAHSGKGSSAFEQKCDMIIGIEGVATQPFRTLRSLKGRSTTPFTSHYRVEPSTFKFKLEKI